MNSYEHRIADIKNLALFPGFSSQLWPSRICQDFIEFVKMVKEMSLDIFPKERLRSCIRK